MSVDCSAVFQTGGGNEKKIREREGIVSGTKGGGLRAVGKKKLCMGDGEEVVNGGAPRKKV